MSLGDFVVVRTCTYTNLDSTVSIWYSLLLLGYKPLQHVTVLNTVGNCNTMASIIILYYNIYYYFILYIEHYILYTLFARVISAPAYFAHPNF
jgi:hypothetical protein